MNQSDEFRKYATKHIGINSIALHDYEKAANSRLFMPKAMTPSVIEERQMNAVIMSVFDRLMMDRIIFLGMGINDTVANVINAQLLYLESIDDKKAIQIFINSPGGSVYDGLGVYDTMQYIKPKIATVNTGMAASMAFVLMVSGEKGHRTSLPHARFMQHQPMGGAQGQASDIQIVAREIDKLKTELYEIISKHTGQTMDKVTADCDRDYWMTAKEAQEYGCIDIIPPSKKK
jgi:ATP-dependent Clp protease protease subunit